MEMLTRREAFKTFFNGVLGAAGTVVLASTVLPAQGAEPQSEPGSNDLQERADQLAENQELPPCATEVNAFVNGAFRNGGGFRNGGFANGGFRNGSFRNGGFANGGFRNGAFRNGGFRNF